MRKLVEPKERKKNLGREIGRGVLTRGGRYQYAKIANGRVARQERVFVYLCERFGNALPKSALKL